MRKCNNGPCYVYFFMGPTCPGCSTKGVVLPPEQERALLSVFNVTLIAERHARLMEDL